MKEGWTQLAWAQTLTRGGRPGDAEQARQLLGRAVVAARELGLGSVERRAAQLLGGS